jgi:uncharacterized membrane protein SpoIIM required for sporulation
LSWLVKQRKSQDKNVLDPNRFVKERKQDWEDLEAEMDLVATGAFKAFDVHRARRLGSLYRRVSADLIRVRSETANEPLNDYLNSLVGRSYATIYRGKRFRWTAILIFLFFTFPAKVRVYKKSIFMSGLIFFLGLLFGVFAEYFDSSAKYYLLSPKQAEIEKNIEAFKRKSQNGGVMAGGVSGAFSAQIMTNNIQVSFLAFALGATAGIGTFLVMFHNGVLIGVLAAIFMRHSLSLYFWAYILPHGVLELFCIFVAGAAGFLIARAIVAPGLYGRREALRRYGREAIFLVTGCGFLLILAGLIEGFITPQGFIPHGLKLLFAFMSFLALVAYLGYNESILASLGFEPPNDREDPLNMV